MACRSANLSTSYFTNRQDRYIHFSSSPALVGYCLAYLDAFKPYTYRVEPCAEPAGFQTVWTNVDTSPQHTETQLGKVMRELRASFQQKHSESPANCDSWVVPSIQAGYMNIRDEEETLGTLFQHVRETGASIDLTSGYFGLYKAYQQHILECATDCRVVAASPLVCSLLLLTVLQY
jgi:CDP-diacylglycerol--glycerol-3-phosphate 3-phosphatidyltransferase